MNIHIIKTKRVDDKVINSTLEILSGYQSFNVRRINGIIDLIDNFNWETCFDELKKVRANKSIPDDDYIMLLTDKNNNMNWFSGFDRSGEKSVFIHAADWDNFIFADLEYIMAYQIISKIHQYEMHFFIQATDFSEWAHANTIGCMNDFCEWKQDVHFKFKTGDICQDCIKIIEQAVSPAFLKDTVSIFNEIRKQVVSTKSYFVPPDFDKKFFTPIAITKRKITTSSDPLRKSLFAIDHFDLLIKTVVIFTTSILLDKNGRDKFMQDNDLSSKPSLGHWVTALSKLNDIDGADVIINPIKKINNQISAILRVSKQNKIVTLRNEYRGHGYISCSNHQYLSLFNEISSALSLIENIINQLFSDFNLIKVITSDWIDDDKFSIRMNVLSGSNLILEDKEIILKTSPKVIKGTIYLVRKDYSTFYNLSPHFIFDNCPECDHSRLMVKDGDRYIDIYIGHRVKLEHIEL